jgi:alkylation response protein AidB-like acyl-CoA dehydrogenase
MAADEGREVSERESLEVAEASRQAGWDKPGFLRELFLGRFRLDLVHPFPLPGPERPEFASFLRKLEELLRAEVDPAEIDRTGEYPSRVLEGLRRLGAFGMKIPARYGGLGFSNAEYGRAMTLVGSHCGSVGALLSAHQSIGVPQPVKAFGTEELKRRYLPRCGAGEISAFALTEPGVGSDPAHMRTTARKTADGAAWVLNGRKLWTTNGTIARLLVVMAMDPDTRRISAFVVEADWPGVTVAHRCRFMGLRAIANAVIDFEDVLVPAGNLIGQEGRGLKVALTTLNEGRLSVPCLSLGAAKACLGIVRRWAGERVQWGKPIGRHEAIAHKISAIAASTFAMEAVASLASEMSDRGLHDIRLEAAAAKEWTTGRVWEIADETMQIRGGRGYETEASLAARGEEPVPVERILRDHRIGRIFEGSSEILHLFMAREMVDEHLQLAGALVAPDRSLAAKLAAVPGVLAHYAWWYPTRWLGWGRWPRYVAFGPLARHLRFVERTSRRLARASFHAMLVHRGRLPSRQAVLFRLVDIAVEAFAMTAAVSRAHALARRRAPEGPEAVRLADVFCRSARRRVEAFFRELSRSDDVLRYRHGLSVLSGEDEWVEAGILGSHPKTTGPRAGKPEVPARA